MFPANIEPRPFGTRIRCLTTRATTTPSPLTDLLKFPLKIPPFICFHSTNQLFSGERKKRKTNRPVCFRAHVAAFIISKKSFGTLISVQARNCKNISRLYSAFAFIALCRSLSLSLSRTLSHSLAVTFLILFHKTLIYTHTQTHMHTLISFPVSSFSLSLSLSLSFQATKKEFNNTFLETSICKLHLCACVLERKRERVRVLERERERDFEPAGVQV